MNHLLAARDVLINKANFRDIRLCPPPPPPSTASTGSSYAGYVVGAGQILVRVDRFALTSNNVSYMSAGKSLKYWNFFQCSDDQEGWGRVPVWGFATVAVSNVQGLRVGETLYGYYPMSDYLIMEPRGVGPSAFTDDMSHRKKLPPAYNSYLRVSGNPLFPPAMYNQIALFYPLFITAFLIDDFLGQNSDFQAKYVILSSASSKTSLLLASLLYQRSVSVIGLTSSRNVDFVESLPFYQSVFTYDASSVGRLDSSKPVVFVDMAGNKQLTETLHELYRQEMKYSCKVGTTHWESGAGSGGSKSLPGSQPEFFFAPTHYFQAKKKWGKVLDGMIQKSFSKFLETSSSFVTAVEYYGLPGTVEAYQKIVEGEASPTEGNVVVLHPPSARL